jgi:hypothetical protein
METSEQGKAKPIGMGATTSPAKVRIVPFDGMTIRLLLLWVAIISPLLILAVIFFYCSSVSQNVSEVFVPSVMAALAAMAAGGFLGFLFAIPRAQPADQGLAGEAKEAEGKLVINTNLEQVSDWLTKIIVGVTLVELGKILPALGRLVEALAAIYGSAPGATVMAATILIFYSITGFFDGYVGTRSLVTVLLEAVRRS